MRILTRSVLLALCLLPLPAFAALKGEEVTYQDKSGTVMTGYVAYDDAAIKPRPGILIIHDWMGLGDFTRQKADQLARAGYVAFAADIYGKGVRPANAAAAGKLATHYKADRPLLRQRVRAAYDTLHGMAQTTGRKILVMGYCFGGTTALELARSGVPLAGTASFHGGLDAPMPANAGDIKGPVLVMHGADDPFVPPAEVAAFKQEMAVAQADLRFVAYPGAVHAFTNPAAGSDNSQGAAYNAAADKESWAEFRAFLKETLKEPLR